MSARQIKKRFWSLRKKWLFFSVGLLSFPFLSINFLQQLEGLLAENLVQGLIDYGNSIAYSLRNDILKSPNNRTIDKEEFPYVLYVPKVDNRIEADGYLNDWENFSGFKKRFKNDENDIELGVGSDEYYFYLQLNVMDSDIVYREVADQFSINDTITIDLVDDVNKRTQLLFSPVATGRVTPFLLGDNPLRVWNGLGFWQEHATGYSFEVKIPMSKRFRAVAITVSNYQSNTNSVSQIKSFSTFANPLLWPVDQLDDALTRLSIPAGKRVWIVNSDGLVLSRKGHLNQSLNLKPVNPLIHFILNPPSSDFDPRARSIQLNSSSVQKALAGERAGNIERIQQSDSGVAIAAVPIIENDRVLGAIVIEESVAAIQLIQRDAMNEFINKALIILFIVVVLFIFLASRLAHRLMTLNEQSQAMIDSMGRVQTIFKPEKSNDEVGQLSQSLSNMGERLKEYNEYMDKLSSRLSHELRTPIAMVRSSIDNLSLNAKDEQLKSIENAQIGINRLSQMISRMQEAARLENFIMNVQATRLDLVEMVQNYVEAVSSLYDEHFLSLDIEGDARIIHSSPDLIAQLLDKLLSNAKDFASKSTVISVKVIFKENQCHIWVSNIGPLLPDLSSTELFSTMTSVRNNEFKMADQVNLGLGLYIVRLIAEYHQGEFFAQNKKDGSGVEVGIAISGSYLYQLNK